MVNTNIIWLADCNYSIPLLRNVKYFDTIVSNNHLEKTLQVTSVISTVINIHELDKYIDVVEYLAVDR